MSFLIHVYIMFVITITWSLTFISVYDIINLVVYIVKGGAHPSAWTLKV